MGCCLRRGHTRLHRTLAASVSGHGGNWCRRQLRRKAPRVGSAQVAGRQTRCSAWAAVGTRWAVHGLKQLQRSLRDRLVRQVAPEQAEAVCDA
jgi:hypothetical protein